MDGTARIEMRPRRVDATLIPPLSLARSEICSRDADAPRDRHPNLISGCVWSLASPAAYTVTVRACVSAYGRRQRVHSRTRHHHRRHRERLVTALVISDGVQPGAGREPRGGLVHRRHSI